MNLLAGLAQETAQVQKGTVLMKQGESGNCAYFVVQGRLLVEIEIEGKTVVLGEIGTKDIVGELAILDNAPRSATVTALEDCLLIVLDKVKIRNIIRRSPEIAEVIMKLICHKLRKNHELINKKQDLSNPDSWRKICAVLRLCAKGDMTPQQRFVSILENLKLLEVAPIKQLRTVIKKLQEAQVIELQGSEAHSIDVEKLETYLVYSQEEFHNEGSQKPTTMKLHQAAQALIQSCNLSADGNPSTTIPMVELTDILVNGNLWEELHNTIQDKRADVLVNEMAQQGLIAIDDEGDMASIEFATLKTIPEPMFNIESYKLMKSVFFPVKE